MYNVVIRLDMKSYSQGEYIKKSYTYSSPLTVLVLTLFTVVRPKYGLCARPPSKRAYYFDHGAASVAFQAV